MKILYKLCMIVIVILLPLSSANAAAKKETIGTILNLGEQMSGLVNMLETYTLIGMGVSYQVPTQRLKESITAYDMMLVNLKSNFSDPQIRKSVNTMRDSWKRIRRALYGVIVLTDIKTMKINSVYINEKLRLALDELTNIKTLLLKKTKKKNKELIGAAIQVGVSAERLSSNYMMKIWEIEDPNIKKYWDKNLDTLQRSLKKLKASPFAQDPAFKKYLAVCDKEFGYFKVVYEMDMRVPALIHKRVAHVLSNSNKMIQVILAQK